MKFISLINEHIERIICIFLMSGMTIILAIQVFMRYVVGDSLSWSEEVARYMFIWLIYIGISYGAKMMAHIKIEAALGVFPGPIKPYIVILSDILFLFFSLYVIFYSTKIVEKQLMLGQLSPAVHMPMWMIYSAPAVGFAMTSFRQCQVIIYRIRMLSEGEI